MEAGGIQRGLLNLATGLIERGYEVDLLLRRKRGAMLDQVPPGVRVIEARAFWPLAARALYQLPASARAITKTWLLTRRPRPFYSVEPLVDYLRAERPVALLATPTTAALAALWAAHLAESDVRVVAREANTLSRQITHQRRAFGKHLPSLIAEWYPRAAGIVAPSQGVAEELAALTGLARDRIETIHNPVDVGRIRALAVESPDDPWLTTPNAPPVVLGAGRLVPAKDFPTLLRAFAGLRRQRPARLVILGEGRERRRLLGLASDLGVREDVRLTGHVANPFAYMARASVFALSSLYEGLANVLREALVCGCPVVATDCPSGSAEVLGHGRYGRLVPVGDAPALGNALAETLEDPRARAAAALSAVSIASSQSIDRYQELLLGSAA